MTGGKYFPIVANFTGTGWNAEKNCRYQNYLNCCGENIKTQGSIGY
jgi:hypothetical protein